MAKFIVQWVEGNYSNWSAVSATSDEEAIAKMKAALHGRARVLDIFSEGDLRQALVKLESSSEERIESALGKLALRVAAGESPDAAQSSM